MCKKHDARIFEVMLQFVCKEKALENWPKQSQNTIFIINAL